MNAATRIRIVALLASFIVTAEAGPPTFTLTVDVDGYGTVVLDPDREAYKRNNIVNLEAIPDEGYVFYHWVGDLSGDANPVTLRVSDNHSVTAVFVEAGGGGQ